MEKTVQQFEFIISKFTKKIDLNVIGITKPHPENEILNNFKKSFTINNYKNLIADLYDFFEIIDKHEQSENKSKINYCSLLNMDEEYIDSEFYYLSFIYAFRHKDIIDNKILEFLLYEIINEFGVENDLIYFCETYEEGFKIYNYVEQYTDKNIFIKTNYVQMCKALAMTMINLNNVSKKNENLIDELDKLKLMPPMFYFRGGELFQQSLKEAFETGLVKEEYSLLYGDCDSMYD